MRTALSPYATRHTPYAFVAAAALCMVAGAAASEGATRIAILPFQNVSGHVQAPAFIMPLLAAVLEERGYDVVGGDPLESFLAERRIRATSLLNREQLAAVGREFGASLVLVGSIDLFVDSPGNPQWGLSGRILETASGRIVWADAAGFSGDDFTGFLGLGTITSPEVLAVETVQAVFRNLSPGASMAEAARSAPPRSRKLLRRVFRSSRLETDPPRRIAVLPFVNGTERRGAALIVDDLMLVGLFRVGRFELEDAGEIHQALQSLGFAPFGGIDLQSLHAIGEKSGVDGVILGRVEEYNEGLRPGTSTSPSIALDARMLDVKTGEILWMGYHEAWGEDSQIVLEFGKIKSMVPLGMKVILELVGTM